MDVTRFKPFSTVLARAVEGGLVAAALVDRSGNTVGLHGAITDEESMPLAALVMYRLQSANLASRLFAGEILALTLDDRDVAVGIAKRQLFVVAVLGSSTQLALVRELRDDVAGMLDEAIVETPPWGGTGGDRGSGSGPAGLPLIEYGITVARERGKA